MSNQVGLLPPQSRIEAIADLARHPAIGGWKELAVRLNTTLADDPEGAGKWLHRALDGKKRDVFHDGHMRKALRLGCAVGCHVLWHWHSNDVGYNASDPLKLKSRKLMLLEEQERIAMRNRQIQEDLEELNRIDPGSDLKAVK